MSIIAPVTDQLRRELVTTSLLLDRVNGAELNDVDHFTPIVGRLEEVAVSILGAMSAAPMTGPQPLTARFSLSHEMPLSGRLIDVVGYLRDTAAELLHSGGFDKHTGVLAEVALSQLKALYSLLLASITQQSEQDLKAVRRQGVVALIDSSSYLARLAAQVPEPVKQPRTAEDADGTWNPAG